MASEGFSLFRDCHEPNVVAFLRSSYPQRVLDAAESLYTSFDRKALSKEPRDAHVYTLQRAIRVTSTSTASYPPQQGTMARFIRNLISDPLEAEKSPQFGSHSVQQSQVLKHHALTSILSDLRHRDIKVFYLPRGSIDSNIQCIVCRGLLVNSRYPWLACSPDAIALPPTFPPEMVADNVTYGIDIQAPGRSVLFFQHRQPHETDDFASQLVRPGSEVFTRVSIHALCSEGSMAYCFVYSKQDQWGPVPNAWLAKAPLRYGWGWIHPLYSFWSGDLKAEIHCIQVTINPTSMEIGNVFYQAASTFYNCHLQCTLTAITLLPPDDRIFHLSGETTVPGAPAAVTAPRAPSARRCVAVKDILSAREARLLSPTVKTWERSEQGEPQVWAVRYRLALAVQDAIKGLSESPQHERILQLSNCSCDEISVHATMRPFGDAWPQTLDSDILFRCIPPSAEPECGVGGYSSTIHVSIGRVDRVVKGLSALEDDDATTIGTRMWDTAIALCRRLDESFVQGDACWSAQPAPNSNRPSMVLMAASLHCKKAGVNSAASKSSHLTAVSRCSAGGNLKVIVGFPQTSSTGGHPLQVDRKKGSMSALLVTKGPANPSRPDAALYSLINVRKDLHYYAHVKAEIYIQLEQFMMEHNHPLYTRDYISNRQMSADTRR